MAVLGTDELDAVLLCGGLGTRLGEIVKDQPKPMVRIKDRPFLDILIDHLAAFGIRRFVLCSGYKSESIAGYYQKKEDGRTYLISREETPLGTAGALKNAEGLIDSEVCLVLNGDSFCPVDIKTFHEFHKEKNAAVSIALAQVEESRDYGAIVLSEDSAILGFNEKSSTAAHGLVNAGVYCFRTDVLGKIPPGKKLSLEYDIFPSLVDRGLYGFVTRQRLFDIGTPERLAIARQYFG